MPAMQQTLFGADIDTEGIKYAGSKKKIIPHILGIINKLDVERVFDGFAGTTRVSQALSQSGYDVILNDSAVWSKVFGRCYLVNNKHPDYYREKIKHLNNLDGKEGWFTKKYGGEDKGGKSVSPYDGKKKPWQIKNTKKLDSIREEIDRISRNEVEKSVYITSLILALDKVDSTIGHYSSYLKEWSSRSYKDLNLKAPKLNINERKHRVYSKDIFNLISKLDWSDVDISYYDPPYGSNNEKMPPSRVRYNAYYHIWKTVCLNDKPDVWGAANRRSDSRDNKSSSVFEDYHRDENGQFVVINALEKLLKNTKSKFILLSYSNKGRATRDQLVNLIRKLDMKYKIAEIDHDANVMGSMRWTDEWVDESDKDGVKEYLFLMSRSENALPESI